ncbi:MAG: alpha/beta hydrolase [Clostridia bacterium]|nr:alpha/beta hydrolase [Clostridia bacterium]
MAKITIANNPAFLDLLDMKANIVFSTANGEELALQLVKPQWSSGGQGFPLVVFIQGSAWTKPNQFWEIPQLCELVRRGFVIASVTHRSCFQTPAPAFLKDVKAALRFLKAHAEEYDIDKSRVCAWGTSSGGNTALLLGVTADDPAFETEEWAGESTRVQAVVDCFGPADMAMLIANYEGTMPLDDTNILYALGGRDPENWIDNLKLVSPAEYVRPGRDLPPFLILHGDADDVVPYADSEAMHDKLIANGYEADLVCVKDAPHEGNFWSKQLLTIIFDFIEKQLK